MGRSLWWGGVYMEFIWGGVYGGEEFMVASVIVNVG